MRHHNNSSDGALIIINGHYSLAYFESTALISRANEEWVIVGSEGKARELIEQHRNQMKPIVYKRGTKGLNLDESQG